MICYLFKFLFFLKIKSKNQVTILFLTLHVTKINAHCLKWISLNKNLAGPQTPNFDLWQVPNIQTQLFYFFECQPINIGYQYSTACRIPHSTALYTIVSLPPYTYNFELLRFFLCVQFSTMCDRGECSVSPIEILTRTFQKDFKKTWT